MLNKSARVWAPWFGMGCKARTTAIAPLWRGFATLQTAQNRADRAARDLFSVALTFLRRISACKLPEQGQQGFDAHQAQQQSGSRRRFFWGACVGCAAGVIRIKLGCREAAGFVASDTFTHRAKALSRMQKIGRHPWPVETRCMQVLRTPDA